jgi:hypothetical protein
VSLTRRLRTRVSANAFIESLVQEKSGTTSLRMASANARAESSTSDLLVVRAVDVVLQFRDPGRAPAFCSRNIRFIARYLCQKLGRYSARSASIGSTRVALRAGR